MLEPLLELSQDHTSLVDQLELLEDLLQLLEDLEQLLADTTLVLPLLLEDMEPPLEAVLLQQLLEDMEQELWFRMLQFTTRLLLRRSPLKAELSMFLMRRERLFMSKLRELNRFPFKE